MNASVSDQEGFPTGETEYGGHGDRATGQIIEAF